MSVSGDDSQPSERLDSLRSEAASCRACPLWKNATQTVFGEGPPAAEIMFVGEQPGDKEDREGRPFVGPAGLLLDRALAEAGVDRGRVYVTNAVKHFKFEPRGKRRLHKRPNASEVKICRRWLAEEIEVTHPRLIVALGATAAQGLAERAIPIQSNRGKVLDVANGLRIFITIHPSALLRLQDEDERRSGYASFVNDLRSVEQLAKMSAAETKADVRAAG
ncbi:MAG TPA: UdgX family uracil-DNA binding protein [Roseiarcus sp.]